MSKTSLLGVVRSITLKHLQNVAGQKLNLTTIHSFEAHSFQQRNWITYVAFTFIVKLGKPLKERTDSTLAPSSFGSHLVVDEMPRLIEDAYKIVA